MRFTYTAMDDPPGSLTSTLALRHHGLAMLLHHEGRSRSVVGLVDSGSAVNLLPYSLGLALGATWDEAAPALPLAGSFARFQAHGLLVAASHPQLTADRPLWLAFAWTQRDDVPPIFGQMNFFLEFDVCFFRSLGQFDVRRKGEAS